MYVHVYCLAWVVCVVMEREREREGEGREGGREREVKEVEYSE